jgi:hypothetical protein
MRATTIAVSVALALAVAACGGPRTKEDIRAETDNFPTAPSTVTCPLEVKVCPDGSTVHRVPPSCLYEACP